MPLETGLFDRFVVKDPFHHETGSPHFFSGIQSESELPFAFGFPVRP